MAKTEFKLDLPEIKRAENNVFNDLRIRFDQDLLLYYLNEYIMLGEDKKPIPHVENVTLNDPATYADRTISLMSTAKMKMEISGIESDPGDEIANYFENYFKHVFRNNDEMLSWELVEDLKFCSDWYSCIRGWLDHRVLVLRHGDYYIVEIMPIDPRWISFAHDKYGLSWHAHRYRLDKWTVRELYDVKNLQRTECDMVEGWDRNNFHVWCNETEVPGSPWRNPFGFVPFNLVPVRTKPLTMDNLTVMNSTLSLTNVKTAQGLARQGESIYRANRGLYPKANALASTWATLNKIAFMTPLAFISPGGRKLTVRPYGPGIVVNLRANEKLLEIPTKEIAQSGQSLFGQYSAFMQRGQLPHVDYGNLSFELSAVAIARLSETRDQILNPRHSSEEMTYTRDCRMIQQEVNAGGFPLDKIDDRMKSMAIDFDPEKMKKNFQIFIKFQATYPEQNLANITVAQAVEGSELACLETILRDYMQHDDWKGELKKIELHKAHQLIEELRLLDFALDIAPIKELSNDERDALRANMIYWKLEQMTGGAFKAPVLQNAPQSPSQPRINLNVKMPKTPTLHTTEEETRRTGARVQEESAQEARNG